MRATLIATTCLAALAMAAPMPAAAQAGCALANGPVKRVVFLEFDNVHNERDRPHVLSDLEQLPALRNLLLGGVLATNDHTSLISHTANDILVSETGVYSDRLGSGIANAFGWYGNGSTSFRPNFDSTFTYWTDAVSTNKPGQNSDTLPILLSEAGKNAPAPWTVFTKAGCDFGATAIANSELENNTTDVIKVFGKGSREAMESLPQRAKDFEGIAIHCANSAGSVCNNPYGAPNAVADVLPDEPGGYAGFKALFGHKYAVPAINGGSVTLYDLSGNPVSYFPGYDQMQPKVTLAYAAQMLEAGVPVVYGYMADAHDNHAPNGNAYGPGEAGYVAQLQAYNEAFATFFARLQKDGFTPANTLFLITTDEQDYFSGGQPTPPNCDGVGTACHWVRNGPNPTIGEVDYDLGAAVAGATGNNVTFFDLHYDVAPNFYLFGNAPTPYGTTQGPQPGPLDPAVRGTENTVSTLAYNDPYTGKPVSLERALADQAEMKLLHMISADPRRNASFTMFAYPNTYDSVNTSSATQTPCIGNACVSTYYAYAWEHGGIADRVSDTWFGMVGPGVKPKGQDSTTWSDHADFRPTLLSLAGLTGAYAHDGRVLVEDIQPGALPSGIAGHVKEFLELAAAYKQLNAPFGNVSVRSLKYATPHVASLDAVGYQNYLAEIGNYTAQRDATAAAIKAFLDNVEFHGATFDGAEAAALTKAATALIQLMDKYARTGG